MTLIGSKRLSNGLGLFFTALLISFSAGAMECQEQCAPPDDIWEKTPKEKKVCTTDLGGRVRRHRHHKNNVITTTTKTYENDEGLNWDSGSEDSEDYPVAKVLPDPKVEEWVENNDCTQQELSRRATMTTEQSTNDQPRRKVARRVRNHAEKILKIQIDKNVEGCDEEWTSSSEEDIAPITGGDCSQEEQCYSQNGRITKRY